MVTDTLPASAPARPGLLSRHDWIVPVGLVVLSLVPAAAGSARVAELGTSPLATPENARFVSSPAPVVAHVLSVVPYSILGALQLWPRQRRRWPRWHRTAGRVLVPLGLVVALSGMWMTLAYDLPAADGARLGPLALMRLGVGTGMVLALLVAVVAVRRRRYTEHGAWMLRSYALAMGAGTQVLTLGGWLLVGGPADDDVAKALLMGLGWAVNIVLAEWVIRRGSAFARP